MDFLRSRMLKQQSPKAPEEEVAIQTLSNRLQHATLAADRRSAVLGLKSFSRQFRESVVQYGLRSLLATLEKDSDSPAMVKAILETLIILFLRGDNTEDEASGWIASQSRFQNGKYPSPLLMIDVEADQFSMWIADEVTSSDAHLQVLINILQDSQDYHVQLYTLQLFEFLVCTRPTRTKELLINIPLAISTIVALLNDVNDQVRNEAILVLMALANDNFNIQKLVAFENTFDKLFEIIDEEGGIRGSILVQDCLTLLTNLLMYNASNQKYFVETEGIPKLAKLLAEPIEETVEEGIFDESGNAIQAPPIIWTEQRLQNMSIALEICKAFVDEDDPEIHRNQDKLFQAGIFFCTMRLVFSPHTEIPIRKSALQITGDIIAGNSDLQLQFSQIDVPYIDPSLPTQLQKFEKPIPAPVALLNWALLSNSVHTFEIRLASVYCLRCFFKENTESKIAFLTDQAKASQNPFYYEELAQEQADQKTDGDEVDANGSSEATKEQSTDSTQRKDESTVKTPFANIFSTLMDFDFENKLNPYRVWFAATILVYLFEECPENRQLARELVVGNAEEGEEVMSSIQAISGILTTNLDDQDPRIAVGLMILLTTWLYEDFDAVNDFLSDPSIIKTILAFLSKNSTESSDLVHGMASILVGVAYEFSQKASPIPRTELHSLVTKALGANNYALKVKQFKECEDFREFSDPLSTEVERDSTGLPKVFFISNYIDLIKDNYYRIRKALSHSPIQEPHIKISYELLEELERKNSDLATSLLELKEQADLNETNLQSQIKSIKEELQESQSSLDKSITEANQLKEIEKELTSKIETLAADLKQVESEKVSYEKSSEKYSSELNIISRQNHSNEGSLQQIKQKLLETENAKTKAEDGINKMSRELFQLTREKKESETKIAKLEKEIAQLKSYQEKAAKDYETQVLSLKRANEASKTKIKLLEEQLKEASSQRDNESMRMRDLQGRLTDAETGNEHLMEKLRAAATVVQDLKKVNLEQSQQVESLKIELAINTRSAQEVQSHQIELNNLRAKNEALESSIADMKSSVGQDSDTSRKNLLEALESKAIHESKANALSKEIEILQQSLFREREIVSQSRASYEGMTQQLELKKGEISEKNGEIENQTAQLRNLESDLKRLTLSEEEYLRQIQEKENELAEVVQSASTLQSALEDRLSVLDIDLKNLQAKSEQENAAHAQMKTEFDDLQKQHNELQDQHAKALAVNEQQLENNLSEDTVKDLEKQIKNLEEQLSKRDEEISQAQLKIRELEEQSKSYSEEILKVKEEFNLRDSQLEETKKTLEATIAELEKSKSELTDELEETKKLHAKELEALKAEHSELYDKQAEELVKINGLYSEAQADRATKDEEQQSTVAEFDELKQKYEVMTEKLEQLQVECASNKDDKAKAEEDIEHLNKSISELREELDAAQLEKDELTEKLKKLEDELREHVENEQASIASPVFSQNGNVDDSNVKDVLSREVANKIAELVAKDQLISEIKRKLEGSTIELEDLTERNAFLEQEQKELTKSVNDLEKVKETLEQKLQVSEEDMKNAIKLNENLIEQLDDKTQELEQKMQEFKMEQDSHKEEISSHKGVEKELTKQLQSIEKELKKRVSEHERDRKKMSGGAEPLLQEYREIIAELELVVENLKGEHEAKLSELEDHKVKITELDSSLESAKQTHDSNVKELQADSQTKISELHAEIDHLNDRCEELSSKTHSQELEMSKWRQLEKEQQETIDGLRNALDEAKNELRIKEERLEALNSELEDANEKLGQSSSKLTELESQLASSSELNSTLVEDLKRDVQSVTDQLTEEKLKVEGLRAQIEQAASESDQLKTQLDETTKRLEEESKQKLELDGSASSLRFEKEKLEDEIIEARQVIEGKTSEISELQVKLDETLEKAKNGAVQVDIASLTLKIDDLNAKLHSAEAENHRFDTEKQSLEQALLESKESFEKFRLKFEQTETDLKKETVQQGNEIKSIKQELSKALASKDTLEKENAKLKTRLDNSSSSKAQLEAELKAAANELNSQKSSGSDLTKQIAHYQSKAKESDELVIDLKTKLSDYMDERMELENLLAGSKSEMENLQKTIDSLNKEQAKLKNELEDTRNSIANSQKSDQDFQHKSEEFTQQIRKLQADIASKTQTLSEAQQKLELETKEHGHAKDELKKLASELEDLRVQQRNEAQKVENVLRNTNSQNSSLEKELREERGKLQKSEQEVSKLNGIVAQLNNEVSQLNGEMAQIKHEASVQARSAASVPAENGQHQQKLLDHIAALKQQLAAKERLQGDFDDLVLLWEEQEKKVTKYKDQLVGLGQQVSSDEEDDESDEE